MKAGRTGADAGAGPFGAGRGMLLLRIEAKQREHRAYWYCQLIGWSLVGLYWSYYTDPYYLGFIAVPLLLAQVGWQIGATHLYARTARVHGWTQLPLPRILPVVLTAWLVLVAQYMLMTWVGYRVLRTDAYGGFLTVVPGALSGGARYLAIWLLAFHGYHLARQSALHAAEAARQAQLVTEARLTKLTGELNPHFLFNALNSIKALTREDPGRARTAIDHLAALLRQSLRQEGGGEITLAAELALVREYLALEQLRFEERLVVDWQLPSGCESYRLPPLSLHTLVENAVKHGISRRPGGGCIAVRVRSTRVDWAIEVTNDGDYPTGGRGRGLSNLRQRLALHYGSRASLTLEPVDATGSPQVVATLKLPR